MLECLSLECLRQIQANNSKRHLVPWLPLFTKHWITSPNGDQRMVNVMDTTTVSEILQQCHQAELQDRHATLIRGVTLLKEDMTVKKADLKDGDEISLVWSDPFVELASCTEDPSQLLYVRIQGDVRGIDAGAFRNCKALEKVVIHNWVTWSFAFLVIFILLALLKGFLGLLFGML